MTPDQQMTEAFKAAPALTVSTMTVAGYAVQEWLVVLTAIYTLLQLALLIRRLLTAHRKGDPACAEKCPAVRRLRDHSDED